jgi:hypothetical protein
MPLYSVPVYVRCAAPSKGAAFRRVKNNLASISQAGLRECPMDGNGVPRAVEYDDFAIGGYVVGIPTEDPLPDAISPEMQEVYYQPAEVGENVTAYLHVPPENPEDEYDDQLLGEGVLIRKVEDKFLVQLGPGEHHRMVIADEVLAH